jgi:hypothetical protein
VKPVIKRTKKIRNPKKITKTKRIIRITKIRKTKRAIRIRNIRKSTPLTILDLMKNTIIARKVLYLMSISNANLSNVKIKELPSSYSSNPNTNLTSLWNMMTKMKLVNMKNTRWRISSLNTTQTLVPCLCFTILFHYLV